MTTNSSRFFDYLRLSCKRANAGELPLLRQVAEIAVLLPLCGFGPGFYHMAGMWRRSMPWAQKIRYRTGARYFKLIERLNNPSYRKISQHKVAEKGLLQLVGVPTARFRGFLQARVGRDASGRSLRNVADFERLLTSIAGLRVCVKTVEGWGGSGFDAVEVRTTGGAVAVRSLLRDEWMTATDYLETRTVDLNGGGLLLEDYIEQHPDYARFNMSSVNTLRLYVRQGRRETRATGGFLRVGAGHSLTDNTSTGGYVARVDLATGTLGPLWRNDVWHKMYSRHPETGIQVEGETLAGWPQPLDVARDAIEAVPECTFAGLDVAMTTAGPMIVELNVCPDSMGAAAAGLSTFDLLGIDQDF